MEEPNVTSIAETMHLTKGAISKIAKRLQRAGLIESYMKPDNQQKIYYCLTEEGKELYDEHEKRHRLWQERDNAFLMNYSPEELDLLTRFMREFNQYLENSIKELGGRKNAD